MDFTLIEKNQEKVISNILKQLYSQDETEILLEEAMENLNSGGMLFQVAIEGTIQSYCICSIQNSDPDEPSEKIFVVEEFEISPNKFEDVEYSETFGNKLREISEEYHTNSVEIMISRGYQWLTRGLEQADFICTEIRVNKYLPEPNNLEDVLDLINQTTPFDRIIQVMFERENDIHVEFIEFIDEVQELSLDGWIPIAVSVSFEPSDNNFAETIESSDTILKWDEITLTFSSL